MKENIVTDAWGLKSTSPPRTYGIEEWPRDGGNAAPPGKPGDGGNGGNFTSNFDIRYALVKRNPGLAGKDASTLLQGEQSQPITYANGVQVYPGGEAAFPRKTCYLVPDIYSFNFAVFVGEWRVEKFNWSEIHTAKHGANANLKYGQSGNSGTFTIDLGAKAQKGTLTAKMFRKALRFVRDSYLAGHLDTVREVLARYVQLSDYLDDLSDADRGSGNNTSLISLRNEALMLLNRIKNHLTSYVK